MPAPDSSLAPYFSGRVDAPIQEFLRDFEELADNCRLTERQKVEKLIRYVHRSQHNHIRTLDGFETRDWDEFKNSLEESYDPIPMQRQYSRQRLYDFLRYASQSRMNGESDVIEYHRQFQTLSRPLFNSQRLTSEER
ncbi:hypothetical protein BC826DRAFT_884641, partial [Russula brevipes]